MRLALRCTATSCPLWRTALTARRSSVGGGLMGTPCSASSDLSLIPVRSLIWRSLKLKVSQSLPRLLPLQLGKQFELMLRLGDCWTGGFKMAAAGSASGPIISE